MEIIKKIKRMTSTSELLKSKGEKIGFVPTMGYLHKGHISLIERARAECSKVFVSIFVNPIQFGPKEDFAKYPRNFKRDCSFCQKAGADYIFFPSKDEMYEKDFSNTVHTPLKCPGLTLPHITSPRSRTSIKVLKSFSYISSFDGKNM